jgi:phospholipid/cholesterol/gamma-HCH transport system permease protein
MSSIADTRRSASRNGRGVIGAQSRAPGDLVERAVPKFVVQLGGMLHLAALVIARSVRPPFSWGGEFASQFSSTVKVCLFPLMLTSFALSFGPVGVQGSGFLGLVGAYDRFGAVYELTDVRLFAPLAVGIIVAGAAGTAICADLGARVVREEISALRVMGVDPIKFLVVPRVLALVAAALLFNIVAVVSGLLGGFVVLVQHHQPAGPAVANFFANATALELVAATLKVGIYGTIIAIVSCFKGMNVSGGPEGVGRAVNQTVVVAFVAISFTDYVFTQLLLATHPILSQVRG